MPSVADVVVLDASALLAYLQAETGSDQVERALGRAAMSTVNLAEVLTVALRARGEDPRTLRPALLALGIVVHEFTTADAESAASMFPKTKAAGLSLGDRACLALGARLRATVLTAERQRDWRAFGIPDVKIVHVR